MSEEIWLMLDASSTSSSSSGKGKKVSKGSGGNDGGTACTSPGVTMGA